jgi:hypothetical protein
MLSSNGKYHIEDSKPFITRVHIAVEESPILCSKERSVDDGKERMHSPQIIIKESISYLARWNSVYFHRFGN